LEAIIVVVVVVVDGTLMECLKLCPSEMRCLVVFTAQEMVHNLSLHNFNYAQSATLSLLPFGKTVVYLFFRNGK